VEVSSKPLHAAGFIRYVHIVREVGDRLPAGADRLGVIPIELPFAELGS
jgi:hypothetical protein